MRKLKTLPGFTLEIVHVAPIYSPALAGAKATSRTFLFSRVRFSRTQGKNFEVSLGLPPIMHALQLYR